jgi:hypothetical protein
MPADPEDAAIAGGMSDQEACPEHVYELTAVDFRRDGSWSTYVCVRCGEERRVGPDEVPPQTV